MTSFFFLFFLAFLYYKYLHLIAFSNVKVHIYVPHYINLLVLYITFYITSFFTYYHYFNKFSVGWGRGTVLHMTHRLVLHMHQKNVRSRAKCGLPMCIALPSFRILPGNGLKLAGVVILIEP